MPAALDYGLTTLVTLVTLGAAEWWWTTCGTTPNPCGAPWAYQPVSCGWPWNLTKNKVVFGDIFFGLISTRLFIPSYQECCLYNHDKVGCFTWFVVRILFDFFVSAPYWLNVCGGCLSTRISGEKSTGIKATHPHIHLPYSVMSFIMLSRHIVNWIYGYSSGAPLITSNFEWNELEFHGADASSLFTGDFTLSSKRVKWFLLNFFCI